jgi:perosamine synthetase
MKREMGRRYTELLADLPDVQLPLARTEYAENIYWVFGLVLGESCPINSEEAMRRLAERKIGTRPFFWPMHEQPVFRKMGLFKGVHCQVAERLARRGFYIPSGLALTDSQIEHVAHVLRSVLG